MLLRSPIRIRACDGDDNIAVRRDNCILKDWSHDELRPTENTLSALIEDSQLVGEVNAVARLEPWLEITPSLDAGILWNKWRFANLALQAHVGVPASLWVTMATSVATLTATGSTR